MTALAFAQDFEFEIEPGVYFASDPVMIGDAMWRVVVKDSAFGGRRFAYEFHPVGHLPAWRSQTRWPAFDLMRPDYGLPMSLAKLYMANEIAIKEAIIGFSL